MKCPTPGRPSGPAKAGHSKLVPYFFALMVKTWWFFFVDYNGNMLCETKEMGDLDRLDTIFFAILCLQSENVFSFRSNLWRTIN